MLQRVQKLLSNYGYCSRRKAEELIKEGRVKVNDKIISLGDKADDKDTIYVDNKPVNAEKKVYLMLNKPLSCVTAVSDRRYKTVMDYIDVKERVFPIGRLDIDTTGLLLLTNDGNFANKVMHPRYETRKTYRAELDRPIAEKDVHKIEKGILLDDGMTSPAKAKRLHKTSVEVTIHEGKKRIVRRMFDKLGYNVIHLQRTRIGRLNLGNLKPGKYRFLNEYDRKKIFIQ